MTAAYRVYARKAPAANGGVANGAAVAEGGGNSSPATGHPPAAMLEVNFTGDDDAVSALLKELVSRDLPVLRFAEAPHDVEELFMRITKGIVS